MANVAHLTDSQRRRLRQHLASEQARTAARADALARSFDDIVTASAESVRDDEHDPEGATIAFERAQISALLQDAQAQLRALQEAAQRLSEPNAGACASCGDPIGMQRLLARPSATRCVRCANRSSAA